MTLFTYIIPASFLSIPFFKIMADYDLLDTYWALILAMTTFASPYALWVLWDYAKTIPPRSTSRRPSTGPVSFTIFFRIYLPLILPPSSPSGRTRSSSPGTSTSTRSCSSRART